MTNPHLEPERVEMPAPTASPLVLGLGVALALAGLATGYAISVVGLILLMIGLGGWIGQLLPGRGHEQEPLAPPERRPKPPVSVPGTVEHLREGMAGYRMRLPEKIHPISAGVKGGIVGGLVMPIPALLWGVLSGNGIWFPINLLAGMVLPFLDDMPKPEQVLYLQQFHLSLFVVAVLIHAVISVSLGLIYGVLLPTLPPIPGGPIIWGGTVMPVLWTGAAYGLMGVVNPVLQQYVSWPWFVLSQFVFGVVASIVVIRSQKVPIPPAGPGGGKTGGLT